MTGNSDIPIETARERMRQANNEVLRLVRESGELRMAVVVARALIETEWGLPSGSIKRWRPGK